CGAELVTSCFPCFTTPAERDAICGYPISLGKIEAMDCLQRLHRGFELLSNITIAYSQIQNIRKYLKTFIDEIKTIDQLYFPHAWVQQFDNKMAEFVSHVRERAANHPAAQCIPPCGLQKAARTFSCGQCAAVDCPFPIACPIQEIKVNEYEKTFIPCGGRFIMSHHLRIVWKFAKDIWTTDLSFFKEIKHKGDLFHLLNPAVGSNRGTYFCEIFDEDDDMILRQYQYVNVITPEDEDERIQEIFQDVLRAKPPVEEEIIPDPIIEAAKSNISRIFTSPLACYIYIGVASFVATIVIVKLWQYALNVDWDTTRKLLRRSQNPLPQPYE
ncbi:sperm acrosome membrane-associated protein 6-like, partial [Dendropsophus ebraccatus]|uniref:sperm acrosome membrane-associated protein 6-like n=1 Tax=Dendropsophus ebraccatus TaxID=150705 RepID=UPI0038310290